MRAALYARVSTEDQVDGYSIDGQIDSTKRYATEHGWSVVGKYVDAGFSARTDERPRFKAMIADAKLGKFDVVLVLKGDRFARNRMHATMYKQLLREAGVRVVAISEPFEEGTPSGVILEGVSEVIAEWYSVDLSVKITDAKRRRAEKGLWNGPVPFGYVASSEGTLAIVPEEAEVVRRAFDMYATGRHTYQAVATWLNQSGARPRVHRRKRREGDYLWSKDTVKDMLANAFYLGYVKHKGQLLDGKHEAIVTQELLDAVVRVKRAHYHGPSTFSQRYRTYLLKGLVRCVHCGEKLWAQHMNGKSYYREESSIRGIRCPNPKAYQRAEVFDEQVSGLVGELRLPESWRQLVFEFLDSNEERMEAAGERRRLEEKLRRVKYQFREGDLEQREYVREMETTKAALAAVQDPEEGQLVHLGDHVEALVEAWALATREEQHDLLKLMLDAVYVDMGAGKVVAVSPKPEFLPLFNLRERVSSGAIDLVTGDPDGIRTHDLRRDRAVC